MKCFVRYRQGSFCAVAAMLLGALMCSENADAQSASRSGRQTAAAADAAFVQQWETRAAQAESEGRWSDAADAWEVLGLAGPQEREYVSKARDARDRARERADEFTRRGEDAVRRADVRRAMAYFLEALSALPSHEAAQRALRQLARRHPFDEPTGGGHRTGAKAGDSPLRPAPQVGAGAR